VDPVTGRSLGEKTRILRDLDDARLSRSPTRCWAGLSLAVGDSPGYATATGPGRPRLGGGSWWEAPRGVANGLCISGHSLHCDWPDRGPGVALPPRWQFRPSKLGLVPPRKRWSGRGWSRHLAALPSPHRPGKRDRRAFWGLGGPSVVLTINATCGWSPRCSSSDRRPLGRRTCFQWWTCSLSPGTRWGCIIVTPLVADLTAEPRSGVGADAARFGRGAVGLGLRAADQRIRVRPVPGNRRPSSSNSSWGAKTLTQAPHEEPPRLSGSGSMPSRVSSPAPRR